MEEPQIIAVFHLPQLRRMYSINSDVQMTSPKFLGGIVLDKSDDKPVVHKHEDAQDAFAAYHKPILPVDLNEGFDLNSNPYGDDELFQPKTEVITDGLNLLGMQNIVFDGGELEKIHNCHDGKAPRFLTFRNNLNKIMLTAYDRRNQWKIRVIRDDTNLIKLEVVGIESDYAEPEKIKQFVYWGRRFEDYCFEKPSKQEYLALQITSIGKHTLIFGAEIDGYDKNIKASQEMPQAQWVEVKTKKDPAVHFKAMRSFNKWALLKSWIQASISGCPTIIYGFRDEKGEVGRLETFKTKKIPERSGVTWNPQAPLWFCDAFLSFLVQKTDAGREYLADYVGGDKITLMLIKG